jgi:hypothetical protein
MTEAQNRSTTRSLIKVESLFPNAIDVSDYITKKFDYEVKTDLYNHDGKCLTYDMMREISNDQQNKVQRPLIVLSPDPAISSATVSGNGERHMTRTGVNHEIRGQRVEGIDFTSELRVLYIGSKLGMCTETYEGISSYQKSVMSNAMGLTSQSFTNHRINIDPSNVIFLGIRNDLIEDSEQNALDSLKNRPMVFDLDRIKEKGIERIMRFVRNRFRDQKVHIIFDMSAIDISIAPSVFRYSTVTETDNEEGTHRVETEEEIRQKYRGLDRTEVLDIMRYATELKTESNLEEFDLVGYNFSVDEYREQAHPGNVVTSKAMLDILKCVADFTDHSINIFDESSRFLIWKKIPSVFTLEESEDPAEQDGIGWSILRGVDLPTRNALISHFNEAKEAESLEEIDLTDPEKDGDQLIDAQLRSLEYPIERFEFPDGDEVLDILLTVTSPMEQNLKSYYTATSYLDRCLLPGEKVNMTFELLATPSTIDTLNEQAQQLPDQTDSISDDPILSDTEKDEDSESGIDPKDLEELRKMHEIYEGVIKGSKTTEEVSDDTTEVINTREESTDTSKRVRFAVA